jgi:hypothetical protein
VGEHTEFIDRPGLQRDLVEILVADRPERADRRGGADGQDRIARRETDAVAGFVGGDEDEIGGKSRRRGGLRDGPGGTEIVMGESAGAAGLLEPAGGGGFAVAKMGSAHGHKLPDLVCSG